jgi:hypothetical protein
VPWTTAAQAALPEPGRGSRRPADRFPFECDAAAAAAAAADDGLSLLVPTAPREPSADALFRQFKGQDDVELRRPQWTTPRAVRPVFLKSPRRVEALVCRMQVALTASQLLGRCSRQRVPEAAAAAEPRRTAESLLREFRGDGRIERQTRLGRGGRATRLTARQQPSRRQVGFPAPAQLLAQVWPPLPRV